MKILFNILILLICNLGFSNNIVNRINKISELSKNYQFLNQNFSKKIQLLDNNKLHDKLLVSLPKNIIKKQMPEINAKEEDFALIVGGSDPNEIIVLSGEQNITGNILVINNGQLIFQNCNTMLKGNIMVMNNGKLQVNGGVFKVLSLFRYEHSFSIYDDGELSFTDVNVSFNGFNQEAGVSGNGKFVTTNTTFENGLTTALMGNSSAVITNSNPLEWVIFDASDLQVSDSDGQFIFWFEFKNKATGDITFPNGDNVSNFQLSKSTGNATGIDYSVTLTNVKNVWWGLMLHTGSNVTVRDSTMRTTGIIPDSGELMTITGLVNNQYYSDTTVPIDGINYRLINSEVETWNIYPWGVDNLKIDNCILGEIGALDITTTEVYRTLIDGTGGYIFTDATTLSTFLLTSLQSDTIAKNKSIQLFIHSSLHNGEIIATDESTILLINCILDRAPQAKKTGLVLEMNIDPLVNKEVGNLIPIKGTAKLYSSNTISLNSVYNLYYGEGNEPQFWTKIGEEKNEEVRNGLLGIWDARNLSSGTYTLKMEYIIENGEPVIDTKTLYLGEMTINKKTLNLPHIANDIQWKTSLVFDSTSDLTEIITGIFYNNSKESSLFSITLEPNKSFEYNITDGECGIVNCSEAVSVRAVYENRLERGIAEFLIDSNTSNQIYFLTPSYNSENLTWMGIALMNPGNIAANSVLTAFNKEGEQLQNINIFVEPNSKKANLLSNLFSEINWENIAYISVVSDKPVTGITISGKDNKQLLFGKAITKGFEGNLSISHIANQWTQWENMLILTNIGSTNEEIDLYLYSNGVLAKTISNFPIPAGNTKIININEYSEFNPECGIISNNSSDIICRQSFRNINELGTAEFVLSNQTSETLSALYPQYASFQLNWMGLALFNSSEENTTVILSAIFNGGILNETTKQINALSREALILSDLFPDLQINEINRIKITSGKKLSVISISGMDQERLLFVPGILQD